MEERQTSRQLKQHLKPLLMEESPEPLVSGLKTLPLKRVVSPIIGLFCDREETVRWRAVTALGITVDTLAQESMEEARVVMRRLMWTLNDESGGIGWGAPEAMGEICARNPALTSEYHRILCSYVNPEGNFLEHETLQRGALWGLCRLAEVDADKVRAAMDDVRFHLSSVDPVKQGLALIFAQRTGDEQAIHAAASLTESQARLTLFSGWELSTTTVGHEVLALINAMDGLSDMP